MTIAVIAIVVAGVVALVIVVSLRSRSAHNSVDSFRRHIDALGPEARRTVIDQVNNAAESDTDDEGEGGTRGT